MYDCDAVHQTYYKNKKRGFTEPHFNYKDMYALMNKVASRLFGEEEEK